MSVGARAGVRVRSRAARILTAALACSLIASASGCSKTATSPAAEPLQITPGAYTLGVGSLTLNSPCAAPGSSNISFHTRVTITHEGANWFARSTTGADGDVEIAFHEAPFFVAGTMHGSGIDQTNDSSSRKQFIAFADGAIQLGTAPPPSQHLDYVVGGTNAVATMTVIDAQNVTVTCLMQFTWSIK